MKKQKLFRFFCMAVSSVPYAAFVLMFYPKYKKRGVLEKYRYAQRIMDFYRRRSRTITFTYGAENLPNDTGYVMYSNHQGKYDAFGILLSHEKPSGVLMEKKQSHKIIITQLINLLEAKRLDFTDPKKQIEVLKEISKEVSEGRRYLISPEGGYTDNHNNLQKFNTGCFRCSIESKTPIVPVCIVDSYKSMNVNNFKPCTTQVHFLKPIPYSEYKDMRKNEICDLVKSKIQEKLDEVLGKEVRQ
jgi:1-acyl-sn-glycerol-3-phosphate acyltransferase